MKCDIMGAELSIANMVMITEAESAREQVMVLRKSTALKPLTSWKGTYFFSKDDPIKNRTLLVKLLAFIRQFHLVDVYLDVLRQTVIYIK